MNTKQLKSPLVAMFASLLMCIILASSKTIHADGIKNESISQYSSGNHLITIHGNHGNRLYIVDGKKFTLAQLNREDKERIRNIEKKLNMLETAIDFKSDEFDVWSDKIEVIAEKMEEEAEQFEETFEGFDFDIDSDELDTVSQKLDRARLKMELKIKNLEKHMQLLETKMPQIDQDKIDALEDIAFQYETLLIDIADGI